MKFALIAAVSALELSQENQFMQFIEEHGRSYGTRAEYDFRFNQFKVRLAQHAEHNVEGATSTQGVNMFSDRTDDEIKNMLGYKEMSYERKEHIFDESDLSDSVDWRTKGAVTPVKDQGQCGSCWAFSTTGGLEGAHFIASGNLVSLSEQQLVDCSKLNMGCNGGLMDRAFSYAEDHAIETEAEYPYTATSGWFRCKFDKSKGVVTAKTYYDVTKDSTTQLKAAIAKGPVSVGLEADKPVFHQYTGGIITGTSCGTQMDHGVLAVGYGVDNGTEFYIVKNSWTTAWGEQGYVRIGIESGAGVCGIQMNASQPSTN